MLCSGSLRLLAEFLLTGICSTLFTCQSGAPCLKVFQAKGKLFLQDMSEVLMLDMGGNSGYAAGLTSPKNAARFSFNEHSSHAASADASDASWQLAEVLQIRMLCSCACQ